MCKNFIDTTVWTIAFFFLLVIAITDLRAEKVLLNAAYLKPQLDNKSVGNTSNINWNVKKGLAAEYRGDYTIANQYYTTALNLARNDGHEHMYYYLLRKKGVGLLMANQLDSALTCFLMVEKYSKENNVDSLLADVYLNLGLLAFEQGEWIECLDFYNSALELYTSQRDTLGIAGVMNNYSLYYKETGDYDKALESALENNLLRSKYKTSYLYLNSLINLGNIYDRLGEYDTALAMFENAYKLSIAYNMPEIINFSIINRAAIYIRLEKYNEAEAEFKKALEYCEQNGNKSRAAKMYSNLGIVYRKQAKYSQALEKYQQALQIAMEINEKDIVEMVYINLGFINMELKNYQEAIRYYNMGLKIATEKNMKADLENIYEKLSKIYKKTGDYKNAFDYLSLASQYRDSVLNLEKVRAIEDMKAKYDKEKNLAQIKTLQSENKIKELEKKSMRNERNAALGISTFIIFLLILLLYFFRMRSRKNRIINVQRIQRLEDEKKLMAAQSVIVGQENERKRIAQELHDGIGVLLSTASIHFSSVSKSSDDQKTVEMLNKAEKLLKQAGGEVRKISQNMMPAVLSKFGLKEAIEDLFEKLEEFENLTINTHILGIEERMPENIEIMLFRVIQEMVNNTIKHARATQIDFSISKGNGAILIDFADNGEGFDLKNLPHNSSLGIYGIQSRVDFLKGKIKIETAVGKGTKYYISVPSFTELQD